MIVIALWSDVHSQHLPRSQLHLKPCQWSAWWWVWWADHGDDIDGEGNDGYEDDDDVEDGDEDGGCHGHDNNCFGRV